MPRNQGPTSASSPHSGATASTAAREFESSTGRGAGAIVHDVPVRVGRRDFVAQARFAADEQLDQRALRAEQSGQTVVFVAWEDRIRGALAIGDSPKRNAVETVGRLHALGLDVAMITGDNRRTAEAVAGQVGIDTVLADVLPEDKVSEVRRLQQQGKRVAMVGDGINDAPALVQADLGVAMGTGTDVAIEASDLTLISGDIAGVVTALALSRRTLRTIHQNLAWAFGYNLAAIPLAALAILPPIAAGAIMATSSISVVTNSLRLLRFGPPETQPTDRPADGGTVMAGSFGTAVARSVSSDRVVNRTPSAPRQVA